MIGTSFHELVLTRASIFFLQYIALLCALLLILSCLLHAPPALARTLAAFLGLEATYALLIYLPFKARLRTSAQHPAPLAPAERRALLERCLENVPDPERYLQMWFLGAEAAEIKRENVKDFVLWAFFEKGSIETVHAWERESGHSRADDGVAARARDTDPLLSTAPGSRPKPGGDAAELEAELDTYLERIEALLGRPLPPGRGAAVPLRLTLDAVETRYRSVLWYAIVSLVDFTTHCALFWHGYQLRTPSWRRALTVFPVRPELLFPSLPGTLGGWKGRSPSAQLSYWLRPHKSSTDLPVVFIHGIGIGLFPYTSFLGQIPPDTGVIALEILPVSMRLSSAAMLAQPDFPRELERILSHHGWDRFVLASHSYGSVLTTHVLRSEALAPRVAAVVLIDPVSVCLHLPDVAYNFTRRKPRRANEWLLWYFASMDPGTALALGRHFFWRENAIWKEELLGEGVLEEKRKVAVSLAARDLIVDTVNVARYLLSEAGLSKAREKGQLNELAEALWSGGSSTTDAPGGGRMQAGPNLVSKDGIEILWFPTLDHAQVFDSAKDRARLLEVIRRFTACEAN